MNAQAKMQRATPDVGLKIVKAFPPNIAEIKRAFPLKGGEIFAWGSTIYNPDGSKLSAALLAHERVHLRQQAGIPEAWWALYLKSARFRFEQELEAHIVEYSVFCDTATNRAQRRAYLVAISVRLASPMYGRLCTSSWARKMIRAGQAS